MYLLLLAAIWPPFFYGNGSGDGDIADLME